MKQLLVVIALFVSGASFAQNEKYVSAMQGRIAALDTTRDVAALTDLSAGFERIADAEKTQWLPYYYAALAKVNSGYSLSQGKQNMAAQVDPIADKAEALLNKAEELSKDNSEIFVVRKMIATLRLSLDPMNRYMTYGPAASEALENAKRLNPENPRVFYLEGQDKFFMPPQFGGSKEEAGIIWQEALKKFDSFKPADALAPTWGRRNTVYFLSLLSK
ncbi:tetratricopeptide repeat protein [Flaviaesturariibacter terrae]